MQEAFIVLKRATQDAQRRERQYVQEGRASEHKLFHVRHAVRELEEAYKWLLWCHDQKLVLTRLWNLVEERNRASVQIPSSTKGRGHVNRRARAKRNP